METARTKTSASARTRSVAFVGLTIAIMAVSAWVTVPLGPVPFTLQMFAITFAIVVLRPKEAIAALKAMGIRKTVMLTGDAREVGEAVARELGLDEVHAQLLPGDKVARVEQLLAGTSPKGKLAFVGDGINDAPVLSRADVGVAMGALGSDAAIEAADVVLVKSSIQDVVTALKLGRATIRNVKQNLFWAFCYNTLGIPVAAGLLYLFGGPLLDPMLGAAAMSLSSVSVVTNALRLNAFDPNK